MWRRCRIWRSQPDLRRYNREAVDAALDIALKVGDLSIATENAARMRATVAIGGWMVKDTIDGDSWAWMIDVWGAWLRGDLPEAKRQLDDIVAALPGWENPGRSRLAGDVAHLYLTLGRTHDAERVAQIRHGINPRARPICCAWPRSGATTPWRWPSLSQNSSTRTCGCSISRSPPRYGCSCS